MIESLRVALADRYRVERELGAGGMATVYLAHDLRHDRKVALKVLRPELAAVIGAARFLVEIKTTANLQHPHILPLHDSGEVEGTVFYVMPYVEGESLRDRLKRDKQLPIDEAIRIATEVADALEYAHQHKIIHRDIKPENIMLQGGHALVADFGIALAVVRSDGGARMTETGMSLGTPHYMSPEQAMGEREISARTDVYALGCVLYEMLAGEPPFTGPSAQAIVARVITEEPRSLTLQRRTVPRHVEAAVKVALAKLPADRFASARAFAEALADRRFGPADAVEAVGAGVPVQRGRFAIAGWVAAVVAVVTLAGGFLVGRRTAPEPRAMPVQFTIDLPDSMTAVNRCCGRAQAISPDGSTLVFVGMKGARGHLYRRLLSRLEAEVIPGTEEATLPFFSPDGQWLGFESAGKLRKVAVSGGPAIPIATAARVWGASWSDGDAIVFSRETRLWSVPASGGEPRAATSPDSSTRHEYPFVLPGGEAALFSIRPSGGAETARIGVVELSSGKIDTLGFGMRAEYASGYLVFSGSDNTLLVQPFDPSRRKTTGPATVILSGVALHGGTNHEFSVSTNGWLEYQPRAGQNNETLRASGPGGRTAIQLPGRTSDNLEDPAISPDGRRIVLRLDQTGSSQGQADLWLLDRQQGTLTRFTVGGGSAPVWSRDGRRIAYYVQGDSVVRAGIYLRSVDQTSAPLLVLAGRNFYPASWLPDGRSLVFSAGSPRPTGYDIGSITLGDSVPRWIVNSEFLELNPQVSPDGRRLAYVSDRTGKREIYVQPMVGAATPTQVSTEGGMSPRWSPDGRTLYYVAAPGSILAAAFAPGAEIAVASRRVAMEGGVSNLNNQNVNWDIFPDGKQFLYIDAAGAGDGGPRIALIQHWVELVRAMRSSR